MTDKVETELPTNHDEALELARAKASESNLARCYIALRERGKVEGLREKAFTLSGKPINQPGTIIVVTLADAEAAIEEAERRGAERACRLIREMCQGCRGTGAMSSVHGGTEECQYCGRVMDAIRARTEGGTK